MRILVVEDDEGTRYVLSRTLREVGYTVDSASSGPEGEWLALQNHYDLILLDLILPGRDGFDVCRNLRANDVDTPILVVTGRGRISDKIHGLDSGADDYLPKPFARGELLARVRALVRRRTHDAGSLRVGELVLDRASRMVRRGEWDITLSQREYTLLEFLMNRAGQVISRKELGEHVWGMASKVDSNVIDVTVSHLRKKLETSNGRRLIHTVRGFGYRFDTESTR